MRTGELAAHAGVNVQTVRFYERRGILPKPGRTSGGYRVYSAEAERTRRELAELGIRRQELVINGIFRATDAGDTVAASMDRRGQLAQQTMPVGLRDLPRTELPLLAHGLVGLKALTKLFAATPVDSSPGVRSDLAAFVETGLPSLAALVPALEEGGHGVIMTMGKGGVGKTTVAVSIAVELARRGHKVHLTTTDPAAHVEAALGSAVDGVRVSRIDPAAETRAYSDEVLRNAGANLDDAGRALLEEDLRSPCTEEIAVFRAFARVVDEGGHEFVVVDTAPTGHTLLLLDAAESYHREVLRTAGQAPDEVRRLLPRLRDPSFTKILLVTLPEATPVHEAAQLQRDLACADIHPFGWVVNQSLLPLSVTDPVLVRRRAGEAQFHNQVRQLAMRVAVVPWRSQATQARLDLVNDHPATSLAETAA